MKTKSLKILTLAVVSLLTVLPLIATGQSAAEQKTAVAAEGNKTDTSISHRASRANFILIFDSKGKLLEIHENPITRDKKAGLAMAQWLAEKGVDKFISGDIGRNLKQSLDKYKIKSIISNGNVADALEDTLN